MNVEPAQQPCIGEPEQQITKARLQQQPGLCDISSMIDQFSKNSFIRAKNPVDSGLFSFEES
ncbi:hypothetical protein, partial [Rhizobium sp.]|uniref:hypothetical protein n=1 Tax=Rhizobium sp. TaxID=391 RepID=UPI0034C63F05